MIVRWIWSVPPAIDTAGTDSMISLMMPSCGLSGPASRPAGPVISACTRAAARAMLLLASLPSEPSGPGGRPAARATAARWAVHRAVQASEMTLTTSWRISGSPAAPASAARSATRSGRPARCGYQTYGA